MGGGTKDRIKTDIFKFIKANGIMTLGTSSPEGPWLCTVYYGADDDMNLYIVTDPNSLHGKIMTKNPMVAFNIFDSHQKITKPKKGIQGAGRIEKVRSSLALAKALLLWHKANPGIEKNITLKDLTKKSTDTNIYKIKPKYIKFYNKKLYVSDEYGIWES